MRVNTWHSNLTFYSRTILAPLSRASYAYEGISWVSTVDLMVNPVDIILVYKQTVVAKKYDASAAVQKHCLCKEMLHEHGRCARFGFHAESEIPAARLPHEKYTQLRVTRQQLLGS